MHTPRPGERGFVGGAKDASTGLTHLGAREYDPELGRFISVDPIMNLADPQQMHGYAYSNNNPTTLSDPSGMVASYDDPSDSSGGCPGCHNGNNPITGQSTGGGGGSPVSSPSRQNGPPPAVVVGYGPDDIAGARNTAHNLIVEMERLGWHARYTQTNVSMAVQDGDNVGRYVNVPGIVIGIEFSLPPTCVNPISDVPTITNDSYTREERAAYEAANPDIPEPRDRTAREFLADITGVSAVIECGSTWGCIGAAAMMAPIPVGWIPSVAAATARSTNVVADAFEHGYKYHQRIRQRGLEDPGGHNLPYSFDDEILRETPIIQADNSLLYRKSGEYNGRSGVYEIALNPETGVIFHRQWRK